MTTLTVETGQITAGANTYISEVDAITYITEYTPYKDDFVGYDTTLFRSALVQATIGLDTQYGDKYLGYLSSNTQPLLFPRTQYYDKFNRSHEQGTIPTELKNAQVELAIMIYNGTDPYAPVEVSGNILSKSVAIPGAISTSTTYSKPVKDEQFTGMRRVERVLSPVLKKNNRPTGIHL